MDTTPQNQEQDQTKHLLRRRRRFGVFALVWGTITAISTFVIQGAEGRSGLPILPLILVVWGAVRLTRCDETKPHTTMARNVRWTPMEVVLVLSVVLVTLGVAIAVGPSFAARRAGERPQRFIDAERPVAFLLARLHLEAKGVLTNGVILPPIESVNYTITGQTGILVGTIVVRTSVTDEKSLTWTATFSRVRGANFALIRQQLGDLDFGEIERELRGD